MKQKGQALILLVIAVAAAISVITTAVLASVGQARATVQNELGKIVYYSAESASDQAILKLIRDPSSCSGSESFTQNSISITITYTTILGVCSVTSQAQKNNVLRKIQFSAGYDNDPASPTYRKFTVCCWK